MLTVESFARPSFCTARPKPQYPVRRQLSPVFEPPLVLSVCNIHQGVGNVHCVNKGIALGLGKVKLLQPVDEIDVQSGSLEEVDQVIIERCIMGFG